jgi:hypothetical protein
MIDPTKWTEIEYPIYSVPSGALEDFMVVQTGPRKYQAFYTAGPNFLAQRVFMATGPSPTGPFVDGMPIDGCPAHYTRLSRGRVDSRRTIEMFVYQGLPKCGLYLTVQHEHFTTRHVLLAPYGECSIAIGNPTVIRDGDGYTIFFEGRGDLHVGDVCAARWRNYQAYWDGDDDSPAVPVGDSFEGANPHISRFEDTWWLYYSKWNGHGFDTRARFQKVAL